MVALRRSRSAFGATFSLFALLCLAVALASQDVTASLSQPAGAPGQHEDAEPMVARKVEPGPNGLAPAGSSGNGGATAQQVAPAGAATSSADGAQVVALAEAADGDGARTPVVVVADTVIVQPVIVVQAGDAAADAAACGSLVEDAAATAAGPTGAPASDGKPARRSTTLLPRPEDFEQQSHQKPATNGGSAGGSDGAAAGSKPASQAASADASADAVHGPGSAAAGEPPHAAGAAEDAPAPGAYQPQARLINLAASADGANILAANAEAKKPEKAIDGDIDSFLKNYCSASKWVIIELSQLGRVDVIELTMKELYSSRVKDFSVKGRRSHPEKDGVADLAKGLESEAWRLLGNFTAQNMKGVQSFVLPVQNRPHVRYLLLQFDTHYGHDEVCALNSIRALGVTAAQELEDALVTQDDELPPPSQPLAAAAVAVEAAPADAEVGGAVAPEPAKPPAAAEAGGAAVGLQAAATGTGETPAAAVDQEQQAAQQPPAAAANASAASAVPAQDGGAPRQAQPLSAAQPAAGDTAQNGTTSGISSSGGDKTALQGSSHPAPGNKSLDSSPASGSPSGGGAAPSEEAPQAPKQPAGAPAAAAASDNSTTAANGTSVGNGAAAAPVDAAPSNSTGSKPPAGSTEGAEAPPADGPAAAAAAASAATATPPPAAHAAGDSSSLNGGSELVVLPAGKSAKPGSNLFDVIKAEMVSLRVNQTKVWQYMKELVEALNRKTAELEADDQALQQQVAGALGRLRAEVEATAEAGARRAVAEELQLQNAWLGELLAGQQRQLERSQEREQVLMLFNAAVCGIVVSLFWRNSNSRLFRIAVMVLSILNGLVGVAINFRLLRGSLTASSPAESVVSMARGLLASAVQHVHNMLQGTA